MELNAPLCQSGFSELMNYSNHSIWRKRFKCGNGRQLNPIKSKNLQTFLGDLGDGVFDVLEKVLSESATVVRDSVVDSE